MKVFRRVAWFLILGWVVAVVAKVKKKVSWLNEPERTDAIDAWLSADPRDSSEVILLAAKVNTKWRERF